MQCGMSLARRMKMEILENTGHRLEAILRVVRYGDFEHASFQSEALIIPQGEETSPRPPLSGAMARWGRRLSRR